MVYEPCTVHVDMARLDAHVACRSDVADRWTLGIVQAEPDPHRTVILLLIVEHRDCPIQTNELVFGAIVLHCVEMVRILPPWFTFSYPACQVLAKDSSYRSIADNHRAGETYSNTQPGQVIQEAVDPSQ